MTALGSTKPVYNTKTNKVDKPKKSFFNDTKKETKSEKDTKKYVSDED